MPRVWPFVGLVFDTGVVGPLERVTAPPYDVIGDSARRAYLDASGYNVVRLDLAGEHAGQASLPGDPAGYATAGRLLERWRAKGALVTTPERFFAYEMRFRLAGADRRIRGVLVALELEAWGGSVIPHERTMDGPVLDRLALLRATETDLSAVYGTIAARDRSLTRILDEGCSGEPGWHLVDEEGVRHAMWMLAEGAPVAQAVAQERLLIADGHHRYTTALQHQEERRAQEGAGPWDRVLALVVDAHAEDVAVLPFHRVCVNAAPATAGTKVRDLAEVLAEVDDATLTYGIVSRRDGGLEHRVASLDGHPPTVRALHEQILAPGLRPGIDLRFTPDAVDAEAAVRDGLAQGAYLLPPTTTERIGEVIARGHRLPEKSTFFWPKPRTGMILRPFDALAHSVSAAPRPAS